MRQLVIIICHIAGHFIDIGRGILKRKLPTDTNYTHLPVLIHSTAYQFRQ